MNDPLSNLVLYLICSYIVSFLLSSYISKLVLYFNLLYTFTSTIPILTSPISTISYLVLYLNLSYLPAFFPVFIADFLVSPCPHKFIYWWVSKIAFKDLVKAFCMSSSEGLMLFVGIVRIMWVSIMGLYSSKLKI